MCGIAGFVNKNKLLSDDVRYNILNRMLNRIAHRGPDEMGLYLSKLCSIGNVRLSIVDLKSGQQPMSNAKGNLWIVYNGEVFNFIELRANLLQKGHVFKTSCDTEIVLHMYEEYGTECVNYFNGQFAFAIWDEENESLFMARDRVGIRPLFYSLQGKELVFASEVKSIFEMPGLQRDLDHKALSQVFTFWTAVSPNTVFKGIKELPSGHYMTFKKGEITIQKYWELAFQKDQFAGNIKEACEQLEYLLRDSIDLRLRADVQVAAYLSGGLDSSVTTALLKSIQPEVLNTFSIGFQDAQYDESEYQKLVSQHFNTRHKSITFSDEDICALMEKAVWHSESPLLRTSPVPMMKLSGLVRRNDIKVVITGEGADENLGGYNIFKEAMVRHFWSRYPDSKFRPLLLKRLYPYLSQLQNASPSALKMFFGYKLQNIESPVYSHALRWKNNKNILRHFSDQMKFELNGYDPIEEYSSSLEDKLKGYTLLEKAQFIESNVFMSGYLLSSQGDRVAMANSVEGRYPFLDYRVIEFCASLPDDFKLRGLNEKYILKKMINGRLPDAVVNRPKQAYRAPIHAPILNYGKELIDEYLSPEAISDSGVFNGGNLGLLLNKMKAGSVVSEVDGMAIIGVLTTQILYKQFVQDFRPMNESKLVHGIVRNR